MMRRFRIFLGGFCLFLSLLIGSDVQAAQRYVYDDAELLTAEEEQQLEEKARSFCERWNMDFGMATTADAGGKTSREYADGFYNMHFDITDERGGILYLIDMDNREIYLSTCGMATRYLTDVRIEQIVDEAYAEISEGDYYGTFEEFFEETEYYLESGIPSDQYNYDTDTGEIDRYREPRKITLWEFLLALIAAAVAAVSACSVIVGRYKLKFEDFHYDAYTDSELLFDEKEDRLVNTFVRHRKIQRDDGGSRSGGSSSGSRSSVHRSSGGVSHGGGGRKF